MAFNTMAWALGQENLKPTTKLVLVALADFRNHLTGQCNPSQKTLAQRCGLQVSSINRHLKQLESLGLIRRERRFCPNTGAPRPTQFHFPKADRNGRQ